MKYNVIGYLISEGFKNVFKNKKSTMAALTTMCLCMLVFGVFFLIGENINHMMTTIQEAQGIRVFMKPDTSTDRIEEIGEEIEKINGVSVPITFISKEEGFNEIKEELKDTPTATEGMSVDIVPPSYIVNLKKLELNEQVQKEIKTILGDDLQMITSSNQTISMLISIGNGIRIFTFILLLILVIISIVIISNTIKLTVHARRKEISIMKYVGATNSFIRWPFIVEGIMIGIVAAMISILIVGIGYNVIIDNLLNNDTIKTLNISFLTFADMFNLIMIIYTLLGIGIGIIGSSISMRKYLEV